MELTTLLRALGPVIWLLLAILLAALVAPHVAQLLPFHAPQAVLAGPPCWTCP